jgi:glycerol-3-phosphate dehydrogenase
MMQKAGVKNQLLEIDGVVIGGGVAGLAIALVVPCVHHLTG